jgi:hypothetical protein
MRFCLAVFKCICKYLDRTFTIVADANVFLGAPATKALAAVAVPEGEDDGKCI